MRCQHTEFARPFIEWQDDRDECVILEEVGGKDIPPEVAGRALLRLCNASATHSLTTHSLKSIPIYAALWTTVDKQEHSKL